MKKYLHIIFYSMIILTIMGCLGHSTESKAPRIYRIVIQPKYPFLMMNIEYKPLVDYISRATGCKFEQVSSGSYTNFMARIEETKADFSFQNGFLFISLEKTKGAKVIVRSLCSDDSAEDKGLIITKKGSKICLIEDLKGKRIGIASRKAVSGYLAQAVLCKKNGVNPDVHANLLFLGREDEVLKKVLEGKVDAGFISENTYFGLKDKFKAGEIVEIASTDFYPHWCFVSFRNTDPKITERVKKALLKISMDKPEERRILLKAGISGFVEGSSREYDIVRKAADFLGVPY